MISPVKVWRNQKTIHEFLGKTGEIVSWTIIRVPPEGFSSLAPYPVAIVRLDSGKQITAQVVDWKETDLYVRKKVHVVIRKTCESLVDGVIPYGLKVKPI